MAPIRTSHRGGYGAWFVRRNDRCVVTRKDELDDGHQLPDHSGVGEEEISVVGMSFGSLSLTQKFYANYAKKVGFVTKIRNTNFDKTRKESKIPVNQSIYCTREGYRESRVNAATRANRITATRCKVRMYVVLDNENECWVVSRLELRHSHPCSAEKAVHYHEYWELTMHAKCVITDNDNTGIRPNKTYLALANEGMMNYFVRMKEINPNFFYAIDVDDANKFRTALWVDARCRASYEYFGDVVSFDTTYRRNRHSLPFASFVGVNHHGKSTLLGCAFLGSEEIPSFEWVFTQWFKLGQNRWLADLYANRWKWVPIFFKSEFWAGMRSTQRSESMHAFYGGYLHCKSGLVQFVHEYDNVLGTKEQKELEDDAADSKGVIPCIGSTGIERQFQQEYTSSMFRILQLEVRKKSIAWFGPLSKKKIQFLLQWTSRRVDIVPSCYVLPRWSKNVISKHTYVKSSHDVAQSDESNNLFRHLCSKLYNVAQEFVACDEEAAILRAALWNAKSKLIDYRASMRSTTAAASQNTVPTQSTCSAIVHDIQGPSRVKTKGRPKGKRLGAELDKSIKKSMQKKNRKSHLDEVDLPSDNDHHGSPSKRFKDSTMWNSSEGGGFMHLLNSFRHI
ncbi:protein FAR-RED ELONGATED HYPOCOTYL 3-like [Arachis stenosperma]|uniref:protein FAR-RED ELONGATED HYPOCOTYL 3-like n=1 Tax=Arachis stenosperma TaxID=217475 RepID=UPI0025AC4092|nr:protein FAR-RED ELONGATED HYPOCOTYL 3-like [Arachis stenosperma]